MRVAVGMSGGVDSSLTAHLARAKGHDVIGLTAWLWNCASPDPSKRSCCGSMDALALAREAARALGIPHEVVNLAYEFEDAVVRPTADAYARGLTPNPCVVCNARVRFPLLVAAARERGAERLATGHYARVECAGDGCVRLLRGVDPGHDQSYFLFAVSADDLAFASFPLGGLTKTEVRAQAAAIGHPSAQRASSQDLCFAARGRVGLLAAARSGDGARPGEIRYVDGRTIGRHAGLTRYTVGQRRRIGIAWDEPLYVVELRPDENAVVVGPAAALERDTFSLRGVTWRGPAPREGVRVQIRYQTDSVAATVRMTSADAAEVRTSRPLRAVAPGQAAVFYDLETDEEVVGGGWIKRG